MNPQLKCDTAPETREDGDGRRRGPRHMEVCIRTACAKVAAKRAMWARTGAPTASRGCRPSPQGLARPAWRASRHLQALRTRGPRRRDGRTRNSSDEGHARTMATRSGKTAAVEKLVLGLSLRPCTRAHPGRLQPSHCSVSCVRGRQWCRAQLLAAAVAASELPPLLLLRFRWCLRFCSICLLIASAERHASRGLVAPGLTIDAPYEVLPPNGRTTPPASSLHCTSSTSPASSEGSTNVVSRVAAPRSGGRASEAISSNSNNIPAPCISQELPVTVSAGCGRVRRSYPRTLRRPCHCQWHLNISPESPTWRADVHPGGVAVLMDAGCGYEKWVDARSPSNASWPGRTVAEICWMCGRDRCWLF
ncbi:hypothetical protein K466DRAFT_408377 [Polyporus arcularius HHB13444]|uniref:Uncharacterized protein n=1 Tax=Polyporus arcularius HHB13444 TaxID=1314778 RepID=A0A5C3PM26_9APHY|nr:hypothetical protein K466DRAFT_408377 [Polyporus arcularius HHB13444]